MTSPITKPSTDRAAGEAQAPTLSPHLTPQRPQTTQPPIRELDALWRTCDRAYHAAAVRCGVSDSVADVMYAIAALGEGCTQRDICEVAFTSKQTVNSAVKKLLAEGVLRQEAGPGRSVRLYLTESGHTLSERCVAPVIEAERRTVDEIAAADLEAFTRIGRLFVASLCDNLRDATGDARTHTGTTPHLPLPQPANSKDGS